MYTAQTLTALGELLTRKAEEYGPPHLHFGRRAYRELVYDGTEVPFIPNLYPNTIVCYSYSKSLSPARRAHRLYLRAGRRGGQRGAVRCRCRRRPGPGAMSAPLPCGRRSSPGVPGSGRIWRLMRKTAGLCRRA